MSTAAASTPFPFFASHADAGIAEGTTRGRRREFAAFGWKPDDVPDPMDPATFESARLRWEEALRQLQTDPTLDEETRARFCNMSEANRDELIGRAVARLWRLQQQIRTASQPQHPNTEPS